jgi:tetratricopeptide (TPR) repeat protein
VKNVGNSSQDALKWLVNNQEDWLLFYDNADDPKLDLNKFMPQCNHGNIIITTRNPALRGYARAHFDVSDMEKTDAVELLLKSAGQEIVPANKEIAAKIVKVSGGSFLSHFTSTDVSKELCYLPLAIVQAGAFILQSGVLDSYLEIYMKNRAQLLSEKPAQSYDNYAWTVYMTWQMSFDKLSPPAAMFLQLCSFLHRDGISEEIFSRAAGYKFRLAIPSREELQKPLEFLAHFLEPAGGWDTLRFLKVTNEIKAYSLMSFDPERRMFSIHPLVHSWSQTTITDQESYHSIMAAIMDMSILGIPGDNQQLASLRLISHVDSLRHGNQQMIVNFGAQYGTIYWNVGRYEEAKQLDLAVLEKLKQVLGADHSDTLEAMSNLASTYRNLGEFHKAEELEVVVLEKHKLVVGDDHPDTLEAMGHLASTYKKLAKFHNAEELEVIVLEKWRQAFGDDHEMTLKAMGNLATTYNCLGKFQQAEDLQVIVLEKCKQVLGDDHLSTFQAMGNLASTYQKLGKFHRAEELKVVVLEKRKQDLGDDHPDTLLAMGNLASTYRVLGEFHKAEQLEVAVLEKRKQVLGDDHPETLWAMGNLASTFNCLGEFQQAKELEVVVLEKQKKAFGDNHPDTLRALENLGWTYHQLGQFQKAEELQAAVLEKRKRVLGDNHPHTLQTMRNLALTYHSLNKLAEAKELENLLTIARQHWDIL